MEGAPSERLSDKFGPIGGRQRQPMRDRDDGRSREAVHLECTTDRAVRESLRVSARLQYLSASNKALDGPAGRRGTQHRLHRQFGS